MGKEARRVVQGVSNEAQSLAKVPSGIVGLDEVLQGGFPEGRTTLISGGPGTGKTLLGLEFLYRSAQAGQAGILVSFEERADAIRRNALSMGWDLAALEKAGKLFVFEARLDREAILSGQFNITPLLAIVQGQARAMGATRIVIDAMDVFMRIFRDAQRERDEMYSLHDWLLDNGFTTIMTVKRPEQNGHTYHHEFLDYMADCVIVLDHRVAGQVATKRLRVIKYRGSGFASNEYPYIITEQGSVIMPISTVALRHSPLGEPVSSGNGELDELLGGGYRRASSVLITGASGTGKTTLACAFAREMCRKGEKVLYICFEESQEALVSTMLSPGIDLRPAMEAGMLEFLTVMPEAMGAEQHLARAQARIEGFKPNHVVVDAISASLRMGGESAAFDYLMRLVDLCKQQNITTILTNQLAGNAMQQDFTGIGFSSLIDAIVLLQFVPVDNEFIRGLLILKSRGSKHSHNYHQYVITDDGIRIAEMSSGARPGMTGALLAAVSPAAPPIPRNEGANHDEASTYEECRERREGFAQVPSAVVRRRQ